MSAAKAVSRLFDIVVEEVSLVDRAANKHRFLIVKRDEGEGVDDDMEDLTQDVEEEEESSGGGDDTDDTPGEGAPPAAPQAPALEVAAKALSALTDAVERLSAAEGPARDEVSKVVAELNEAAQQLAKTLGAEPAPSASDDDPIAAVRATLAQVRELVEAGAKAPTEPPPAPAPATKSEETPPPAADSKLDTLLSQVRALAKGLKDQRQQLGQRLGQLEKQVGLPNSSPAGERPATRGDDEDEFWSLDLNQPVDRESVDKSVSFHDV